MFHLNFCGKRFFSTFLHSSNFFSGHSKQRELMEWCTTTFLPARIHFLTVQEARLSYEVTPVTLSQHHQAVHPPSQCNTMDVGRSLLLRAAWVWTTLKLLPGSRTGSISRSCRSLHSFCCMGQICSALLYPYFGNYTTEVCAAYYLCPKT